MAPGQQARPAQRPRTQDDLSDRPAATGRAGDERYHAALAPLRDPERRRPVKDFIDALSDVDKDSVLAAMKEVRELGLRASRHLQGDVYEVRADGDRAIYRVLFAAEGSRHQILLALEAINKKTQRTPPATIDTARRRLADWRRRGSGDA